MSEIDTIRTKGRAILEAQYPEFFVTEMDNGIFYKSLERYDSGDIIEHEGRRYVVQYSWEWTRRFTIPIYCAELEPEGAPPRGVYANDSRLREER